MKKIFLFCAMALMLSGCGAKVPDMTDEQSKQVAEYAAGLLMKYDSHHESRLLNDVELENELVRLKELASRKAELAAADKALKDELLKEKEDNGQDSYETPVVSQDEISQTAQYIDDFYDINGISIRYRNFSIMDTYPENGEYFSVQAEMGKKLLVISFVAKNDSESEKLLDMISLMPDMNIRINNDRVHPALSTLLMDDIANYRNTLAAGEEVTLVLLAKIDENEADDITNISIEMQNDQNSATILME